MSKQDHVAGLDGLRFIAALSVMVSHASHQIYPQDDYQSMTFWVWNSTHLANFGMTLFFVLSGFVIHWNYHAKVQETNGLRNFFIARWARLYPLFLVMFLFGLTSQIQRHGSAVAVLGTAPYFLTFTSSWWFWQPGGQYIFETITTPIIGVMWSLSTEAFFYLVYPLLAPAVAAFGKRSALVAVAVTGLLGAATTMGFVEYSNSIMSLGEHAGVANGQKFLFWLGYHSPLMRFPSFLIGAFLAQSVLRGARLHPRAADLLAVLSLLAIALISQQRTLFSMVDSSAAVFFFAVLCFAVCTRDAAVARLVSALVMVKGGEASYSLYLLHDLVIFAAVRLGLDTYPPVVWLLVVATVAILIARASYLYFERPAQKLFRGFGQRFLQIPTRVRPDA